MEKIEKYNAQTEQITTPNPQLQLEGISRGTVAIEASRAVAEAQSKLLLAKQFPRDEITAYTKMRQACARPELAAQAFYSYPRAGETVSGPTIKLAETLANCWGNIECGIKELSQDGTKSEMQAYCWDYETNTMSVQNFTNPHAREVKGKIKQLTGLRDIYENNANMGARRLRARILAILPPDFVAQAIKECKKTLAGKSEIPTIDRVRKMAAEFQNLGVSADMLEKRLGHSLETMTDAELADHRGIFNSLKEHQTAVSDWFEYADLKSKSSIAELIDGGEVNAG